VLVVGVLYFLIKNQVGIRVDKGYDLAERQPRVSCVVGFVPLFVPAQEMSVQVNCVGGSRRGQCRSQG
jgi:hypothetical protein